MNKKYQISFWIIYASLFTASLYTFFSGRGGASILTALDTETFAPLLFPLLGLIAFTMLWMQFMLGSNTDWAWKVYPGLVKFHRKHGVATFLMACTHPFFILLAYGQSVILNVNFLPEDLRIYGTIGKLAFYTLVLTVSSALLWKQKFMKSIWRYLHLANYIVLTLLWFHSWNLGSDIQSTNLRYLWIFYGISALTSAALRVSRFIGVKIASSRSQSQT